MLKNIKTILLVALLAITASTQVTYADVGDTITITGNTVTSTCGSSVFANGETLSQYWSVSNAYGNGSLAIPCGTTIDITGFEYGTITSMYWASGNGFWGQVAGNGTAEYAQVIISNGNGIEIPTTGIMASVADSAGNTFTSLLPILVAIAGLFLAFYVVKQIVGLIPKAKTGRKK